MATPSVRQVILQPPAFRLKKKPTPLPCGLLEGQVFPAMNVARHLSSAHNLRWLADIRAVA